MSDLNYFPKQLKMEALYRIWAGEKITEVASDYGISRQIVYIWKRKAEIAVSRALEEKKRGPKFRKNSGGRKSTPFRDKKENFSREDEEDQGKIKISSDEKSKISHQDEKRPTQCPSCGCQKIYKNGTYLKKNGNNSKTGEVIQRYICVWCKSPVYLEE